MSKRSPVDRFAGLARKRVPLDIDTATKSPELPR